MTLADKDNKNKEEGAEMAVLSPTHKKVAKPSPADKELNFEVVLQYLWDAKYFCNSTHRSDPDGLRVIRIMRTRWYQYLHFSIVAILLLLSFLETVVDRSRMRYVPFVEIFCLLLLGGDLYLKVYGEGDAHRIMKVKWWRFNAVQIVYGVVECLVAIGEPPSDIGEPGYWFRVSPLLRITFLLAFDTSIRRQSAQIALTVAYMLPRFFLLLIVIFFETAMAMIMFRDPNNPCVGPRNVVYLVDLVEGLVDLSASVTTSNFPDIAFCPIQRDGWWGYVYMVMCIIVSVYLVFNLTVAYVYQNFRVIAVNSGRSKIQKRANAIRRAYNALAVPTGAPGIRAIQSTSQLERMHEFNLADEHRDKEEIDGPDNPLGLQVDGYSARVQEAQAKEGDASNSGGEANGMKGNQSVEEGAARDNQGLQQNGNKLDSLADTEGNGTSSTHPGQDSKKVDKKEEKRIEDDKYEPRKPDGKLAHQLKVAVDTSSDVGISRADWKTLIAKMYPNEPKGMELDDLFYNVLRNHIAGPANFIIYPQFEKFVCSMLVHEHKSIFPPREGRVALAKRVFEHHAVQKLRALILCANSFLMFYDFSLAKTSEDIYNPTWLFIVDNVFMAYYVFELTVSLYANSPFKRYWSSSWRRAELTFIVASLVGKIVLEGIVQPTIHDNTLTVFRIVAFFRLFRSFRIFATVHSLRSTFATVMRLVASLYPFWVVLFSVFYVYSLIGMALFKGKLNENNPSLNGSIYANNNYFRYVNFNDLFHAFFTMFHLMVVNNWYITVDALMRVTTRWAALFYLTFYYLTVVNFLGLLISFLIETIINSLKGQHPVDLVAKNGKNIRLIPTTGDVQLDLFRDELNVSLVAPSSPVSAPNPAKL